MTTKQRENFAELIAAGDDAGGDYLDSAMDRIIRETPMLTSETEAEMRKMWSAHKARAAYMKLPVEQRALLGKRPGNVREYWGVLTEERHLVRILPTRAEAVAFARATEGCEYIRAIRPACDIINDGISGWVVVAEPGGWEYWGVDFGDSCAFCA